jgi:phosphate:Na+ symporter
LISTETSVYTAPELRGFKKAFLAPGARAESRSFALEKQEANTVNALDTVIGVVGGLALFLFGMKVMSDGLQKVAGTRMRKFLKKMTGNRLAGVLTGFLVTGAIQSSSATTVMLVGFVHAGLITLEQSIGVIMGANIGTTVTGWLVAILGFKVQITSMAMPAIALGFFARFVSSRRVRDWGEVVLGFGLLFLGLDFMKDAVGHLRESETILAWMAQSRADGLMFRLVAVAVGMAFTFVVQSSSAALAVTMTLAANGMIDLPTACALAIGQNIGTTITANLAAIGTSAVARQAARAHMLFNVLGSIWPILLMNPFLYVVNSMVPGDPVAGSALSAATIAARLAAFHTLFNLINTVVFLPFTKQLAWLAVHIVRRPKAAEIAGLKYLDSRVLASTPMALHAARNELKRMLEEVRDMLGSVLVLIKSANKKFDNKASEIVLEKEHMVDMLEKEITEYLVSVARQETSFEQSHEITGIINAVSDIERIGDHCESLLKLARRLYDDKLKLTPGSIREIEEIGGQAGSFLQLLQKNIFVRNKAEIMPEAQKIESTIDDMRRRMRAGHIERLNDGRLAVDTGLVFIDMLTSFEKIGDHSYNVAEMLAGYR